MSPRDESITPMTPRKTAIRLALQSTVQKIDRLGVRLGR
jgi:hypothetical protein